MNAQAALPSDHPEEARKARWIALLVAGAFFMENLDGTVITTAVPDIARSFGVAPLDLNIGVSAYLLTLGVFIPISGWVADRFGARTVFAAALALFTIASVLCGMADGLPEFVLLRALQGVGGAMMVPVGRLVVLKSTPKDKLISVIATLTWPALVAPVLGPPLGGFITSYSSWRWIFYLNLPLGLLALFFAWRWIPDHRPLERKPFDATGFLYAGGALLCLTWAAETLSRPNAPWIEAGLFFAFGALLGALAVRHLRHAAHPLIDLRTLGTPTFAVAIYGGSLFRMAIGAVPFLLPLLFQVGFGLNAFHSGMLVIAVFAGNLMMKPATTGILRRFGFRPVLLVNGAINVLSLLACALLDARHAHLADRRRAVRRRPDALDAVHCLQHHRLCRHGAGAHGRRQHPVQHRLPGRHGPGRGAGRAGRAARALAGARQWASTRCRPPSSAWPLCWWRWSACWAWSTSGACRRVPATICRRRLPFRRRNRRRSSAPRR